VGSVALAVGITVAALTVASQTGLLGSHDFLVIALLGLVAAVGCGIVALETHAKRAGAGAALAVLPVVLLTYFLLTSDG
jgi:hypothetical protein